MRVPHVLCTFTGLAFATQWSGVAWANLFARADSIVDTGKLSLAHASHHTLNTYLDMGETIVYARFRSPSGPQRRPPEKR